MYSVGDKVFAKVRGYPAWPARIDAVADATPNKVKYHVFFYGTLETAVCKSEDIYPYAENKESFGKPLKRKYFSEALAQIEGTEPVPELPRKYYSNNVEDDSDSSGNLIIDEIPAIKHGKRKRGSSIESTFDKPGTSGTKVKRRPSKWFKKETSVPSGTFKEIENISTPESTVEIVSRSGRKIKPKRFDDEKVNLPISSASIADSNETEQLSAPDIPKENKSKTKDDKALFLSKVKERRRKQLKFWNTELRMLKLVDRIKSVFSIRKPNPEEGLSCLDELQQLDVDPLMLKKNPHVVITIKKLGRYTGNPTFWKYSGKKMRDFNELCEKVKTKANLLIEGFAKKLNISEMIHFDEVFSASVSELKNKTECWDRYKFYSLIEDPSAKSSNKKGKVNGTVESDSEKSQTSSGNENVEAQEEE